MRLEALLKRRSKLDREFKDVERALSITPKDEGIGEFLKRLLEARDRVKALSDEQKLLDQSIAERKIDWENRRARLQAINEREAREDFSQDDRRRHDSDRRQDA